MEIMVIRVLSTHVNGTQISKITKICQDVKSHEQTTWNLSAPHRLILQ